MRKAQVTLFVILGLVLLLVAVLFMVMRQSIIEKNPPPEQVTHDFSQVLASYEADAARCFDSEALRVFRQLFSHAGYADPVASGFVAIDVRPTSGSALALGDNHLVPFWFEQGASAGCTDNCRIRFNIPSLHKDEGRGVSIEEEAALLLKPLIKPCLDSISFPPDYEVRMADEYSLDLFISEGVISYSLERPVNFTFIPTGAMMTAGKVNARTFVDVQQLYENAIAIMDYLFLYNKTDTVPHAVKTIIQAYSKGEDPAIPPMVGGTVFETGSAPMWLLPDVKERLELYLADNLPLIQLPLSASNRIFLDPNWYSQAIYHTGVFKPDVVFPHVESMYATDFHLHYSPEWDIDLKVSPGGYVIRPSGMMFPNLIIIPQFGFRDYYFYYDVVVPVLVTLTDKDAFDGEGLTLLFAAEVGLSGNDPSMHADYSAGILGGDDGFNPFIDDDFRMEGLVTITSWDALNNELLPEVEVDYYCGDQGVALGVTDKQTATLVTQLPFCLGGQLVAKKEGFYGDGLSYSVIDDSDDEVRVALTPLQEFAVDFQGFLLYKSEEAPHTVDPTTRESLEGWLLGTQKFNLAVDDLLTIIFKRQVLPGQPEHVQAFTVTYENEDAIVAQFAQGTYNVEAYLIKSVGEGHQYEQFIIPEDEFCADDECYTIAPIYFNSSLYYGGVFLSGSNAVVLTLEHYQNDTLLLPYIAISLPDFNKHADLELLDKFDAYGYYYNETIDPRFVDSSVEYAPPVVVD